MWHVHVACFNVVCHSFWPLVYFQAKTGHFRTHYTCLSSYSEPGNRVDLVQAPTENYTIKKTADINALITYYVNPIADEYYAFELLYK